ncbi:MAG TPA: alpha/beta hydrolase [Chitinophagaceae bacterium]|jgi:pimeloyl-ACP methyl ester carboxylesterase|nr:alpha/beta hydrolase [Chitinophagaceae bacterium]
MESKVVIHDGMSNDRIEVGYYRIGSGPEIAFCFHGYGEQGDTFSFLEKYAGDKYSFFAIDLPFHGRTKWPEGRYFSQIDIERLVSLILQQEAVEIRKSQKRLTLIGFSLGGRVALSLYKTQPMIADKIILLAPDGLKVNFWYWLSTQTWLGNKLFAFTMRKPQWFFGFLKLLNNLKLVNASIFKFVNYYIGDPTARKLLYERWTRFRYLKPDIRKAKKDIKKYNTQVRLVYGKHDRIILSSVGKKFKRGIEDQCEIKIIHSGHQVLHEKHIEELLPILLGQEP